MHGAIGGCKLHWESSWRWSDPRTGPAVADVAVLRLLAWCGCESVCRESASAEKPVEPAGLAGWLALLPAPVHASATHQHEILCSGSAATYMQLQGHATGWRSSQEATRLRRRQTVKPLCSMQALQQGQAGHCLPLGHVWTAPGRLYGWLCEKVALSMCCLPRPACTS